MGSCRGSYSLTISGQGFNGRFSLPGGGGVGGGEIKGGRGRD